jgi:copper transport protein
VTFVFTGTPTAVDDGIAVADAAGAEFAPVTVVQTDLEVVATFNPPLAAGAYALAWKVRSDDTHFIDGTISFTVLASVATTALPTTTSPTTTISATTIPIAAAPATTEGSDAAAAAPTTAAVEPTTPTTTPTTAPVAIDSEAAEQLTPTQVAPVAPTLGGESGSDDGENVARIGRLLLFPSAMAAIGMLGFAGLAFAGRRLELGSLLRAVRWLGVGVALGGVIEVVGLSSLFGGFGDLAADGVGRAALGRVAAGVMLVVGFNAVTSSAARSLSAAVARPATRDGREASPAVGPAIGSRWVPSGLDMVGLGGVAILIVSFAFDGHTVSRGPRMLHALASILHVLAAGVWAGGLIALAVILWRRHQDGAESHGVEMVVRFSVVAMVALGMTGLAGVVMALFIDSDVVGYPSTEWGRLMLIKLGVVGVAAAIGAYNHFRIMPVLKAAPNDEGVSRQARSAVTTEAVLVMVVAILTALLVAASTIS